MVFGRLRVATDPETEKFAVVNRFASSSNSKSGSPNSRCKRLSLSIVICYRKKERKRKVLVLVILFESNDEMILTNLLRNNFESAFRLDIWLKNRLFSIDCSSNLFSIRIRYGARREK